MRRTLLVDADIVAFKFAAKGQRKYSFGTAVEDIDEVTPKVDEWLADLKADLKATDIIICLSAPSAEGWRVEILPSYKGNRKDVERPELLQPIKDYMEQAYPSYRRPQLEADDIMGILSTHPVIVPGERIIVSEDKDMKTIPGWLYNPAKDSKPRLISAEEADWWHLYQTIMGDTTDGYTGCPGAGPAAATKILGTPSERKYIHLHEVWPRILELFAKVTSKNPTPQEGDALLQARVARICRASDYDFTTKKVILWEPPSSHQSTRATASAAPTTPSPKKASTASTPSAPKTNV